MEFFVIAFPLHLALPTYKILWMLKIGITLLLFHL